MEDQECPVSGIELMDYHGRPVRKIAANGEEVITIDLGSLSSGSYILRIISDTVYSTVISRK